jgi:PAS domain S-box-containing protein
MKLPEAEKANLDDLKVEYEKFFTVSLDMLCISGFDGYFKRVNPAFEEVLGFSAEELCAKSYLEFIHPEDIEPTIKEVEKQLLQKQQVLSFENRYRCKDGSYKWLSWKSAPVGSFMYAVARDMTESKKAKDTLEILNRELELFSYSVAHDLRAPARSISGFTTLIQEDADSTFGPEAKGYLDRIAKAGSKMGVLIDGLLSLSRLATKALTKQSLNLSSLVNEVTKEVQSLSPLRKANFIIKPDVVVEADLVLLKVVVENILGNAWKYSSKVDHPVTIEFGITEDKTYFIRDNGAGFDPKYADKLFGVFQRLHSEKEFEGTGIGLVTVQRIIERHGGKTWAKSELGKGATFYFTLK